MLKGKIDLKAWGICTGLWMLSCVIMFVYVQNSNMVSMFEVGFGYIDVYCLILICGNFFTHLLAPLSPILTNISSYKKIKESLVNKEKWKVSVLINGFITGLAIVVIQFIILLIVMLIFPSSTITIDITGMFSEVAYTSPSLYILIYFLNSFMVFTLYSWIGFGIYIISDSIYLTLLFMIILYQGNRFVAILYDVSIFSQGINAFPFFVFEVGTIYYTIEKRIGDFIILFLLSVFFIIIGQRIVKKRRESYEF